jgi:hypothetical protein
VAVAASGEYTFAFSMSFKDYSDVKIDGMMCQVKVRWQQGVDNVFRDLIYRSGTNVRNATIQPGAFDGQCALAMINNIQPEGNGFFPATAGLTPPGLGVSSDLSLWIPINELVTFPHPMEVDAPNNGFSCTVVVQAPNLAQLATPGTLLDFWARVQFWLTMIH